MSRAAGDSGAFRGFSLAVRLRYLLLAITIFGGSFLILTTSRSMSIIFIDHLPSETIHDAHRYDISNEQGYTIRSEGCSIPAMEPLSPAIQKYVYYPSSLKPCMNTSHSLLKTDKKKIWILRENLRRYNIKRNEKSLSCCYQAFYRPKTIEDITSSGVDQRVKFDDCKYFNVSIDVQDEFVRVRCLARSIKLYQQYFLFATKKQFMEHEGKSEKSRSDPAYNILILGIDAVSRLNFHRTMPKTISLLKTKGAVEMLGYNKVADNTFPNLIPMLMGITANELRKVCLPHQRATFDNCPFIWEWFKQAGYYTALGEDSSSLGTFNYIKVGFSNTPTDYYLHTFIHAAEQAGSNKDFNTYLCLKDKYLYKILLDYVEDLTTTLKNSKLFGFFWEISMSHDYLNYPMVMDDDYVRFFNNLEANKYLNETIVMMVSDHGIRWGGIRSTTQGRLEERLPFLFILTPPSFREKYTEAYNNLKSNSKSLTTPFDVYQTLSDLVNLNSITEPSLSSRSKKKYGNDRGISLFLPIPYNRTCNMAGISDHWCTCRKNVQVSKATSSSVALEVALKLVVFLNEMLIEYPQCARLSLSEVIDITMMEAAGGKSEVRWEEYMVVLRTVPGGGIFEATLRKDNGTWELLGTASRLNLYGEQSRCVHHYQLKLYCYCD